MLLVSGGAHADDTHYRGIPIGAHAIGLGGAFTGVADDASATYFNPAGSTLGGLGYTRTEAISRVVYLHLTGVTRAAEQIGDKAYRQIRKKTEKSQEEAEPTGGP